MELRCNTNCGGGEQEDNNVPQRSFQGARTPRQYESTSERARTHADATTSAAGSPREKVVGVHAAQGGSSGLGLVKAVCIMRDWLSLFAASLLTLYGAFQLVYIPTFTHVPSLARIVVQKSRSNYRRSRNMEKICICTSVSSMDCVMGLTSNLVLWMV